jgi:glycosyltransferase involved in cell wall biosynthesis
VYIFLRHTPALILGKIDVLDASTGDAWILSLIPRRLRRGVLACRSHGLEHVVEDRRREGMVKAGQRPSRMDMWYWWRFHLRVIALSLRRSDVVFVLHPSEADYAVMRLGCDRRRVKVVPNGVSDSLLFAAQSVQPKVAPRLCFIGSWIERKGIDDLAQLLRDVQHNHPNEQLLILGSGAEAKAVFDAFPETMQPMVEVVSHYENRDLPSLLSGAKILVFPSRSEGYPGAMVEAMACGIVPVCYDIPGPSHIVQASGVGRVVPERDVLAFATAVSSLLSLEAEDLRELSMAACIWGTSQSWPTIAEKQLALYVDVTKI